jgi:hypothetical protein
MGCPARPHREAALVVTHTRPLLPSTRRSSPRPIAALVAIGAALPSAAHGRPPAEASDLDPPADEAAPASDARPEGTSASEGGAPPVADAVAAALSGDAEGAAGEEPRTGLAGAAADPSATVAASAPFQPKPPPLHVEYLQYGVALAANARLATGATCPEDAVAPCILGGGGGLVVRVGWRPPGPWYVGGAYEFANMDSGNLYRLGILQQARAEMRYVPETGLRSAPYATWGVGAFGYGNEWSMETGGGVAFLGGGVEFEVTRFALVGVAIAYAPMLIAGWTDTADQERELSLAQFMRFELTFEVRSELSREDPDARTTAAADRRRP